MMANLWFKDFPPRIHRRSTPQTRCQPQWVTFPLPNITRINSGYLLSQSIDSTLFILLWRKNYIITYWEFIITLLSVCWHWINRFPYTFLAPMSTYMLPSQSFVMEMDKAVFWYSCFPTGISQNTSMNFPNLMYCSTYCLKNKIKLTLVLRCFKLNQVI